MKPTNRAPVEIRQPLAKDKDRERQLENRERELDIEYPHLLRSNPPAISVKPRTRRGRRRLYGSFI